MQFLNEIRQHLENYETEARAEIHKFIDWLHTKYQPPGAPIVAPPSTSYVETAPSFTAPVVGASLATSPVASIDPVEVTPVEVEKNGDA